MSRISEIRHVAYGVLDLEAERSFYRDKWGLVEVAERNGCVHFAAPGHDELFVVRLRQSEVARIEVIALAAATRADVDALHDQVKAAGCRMLSAPAPLAGLGGGYGFRFFNPDGMTMEISCEVARGTARPMQRWDGVPAKISHIVIHSPDHKAAVRFYTDVLGMRVSDWLGDFMCFLRCNAAHHRIAILPGPPCLNHVAYEMQGLDAMMRGIHNLKAKDVPIGWGPGRHTAGNNTFSYFVTPGGFTCEYTAELEQVDDATWQPTVYEPSPLVLDQWSIGVGGPHTLPHPHADPGLFQAPRD
jgi:catechol 2,3-dioxygenase-like lactoylglutathione lyase family enzyme